MRDILDDSLANNARRLSNSDDAMEPGSLYNELIDQYKLEKHVAEKRITDVYQAYDVDENRRVEVEILLPALAAQKRYAEQFMVKMRTVAQIKHPNISHVLQVGTAIKERPYYARDSIEGIPLNERMQELAKQKDPVNVIYALKLMRQIAEATALAERLDIFHYDLSPHNILLQRNGQILIIDLGIPRLTPQMVDSAQAAVRLQDTYWSPEQIQGKPVDARSHVYSMGMILHELLTGSLPTQTTGLTKAGFGFSMDKLRPDLTNETTKLVRRSLRPVAWSRYQSSAEFLTALEEALEAEEIALHTGTAPQTRPWQRVILTVATPLIVLMIAAVIGVFVLRGRDMQNDDQLPVAVVNPTATPSVTSEAGAVTPDPTNVSESTAVFPSVTIGLIEPNEGRTFANETAITFSWTWPESLETGEQFFLYGIFEGQQFVLGRVNEDDSARIYTLTVPVESFIGGDGLYEWQVVLMSAEERRAIAESGTRELFVQLPATPTPVPSATASVEPTLTATQTATPPPLVQVIVSSANLRAGPGTRYDVLRFLEAGDIVTVIATNREEGLWYNVIDADGMLGWLSIDTTQPVNPASVSAVPTAATVPPVPTFTPTPIPTATPIPSPTAPPSPGGGGGGGGGNPNPPTAPPTLTPPPP